jgi:uncharacterized protein GlcG (DUF336 family)
VALNLSDADRIITATIAKAEELNIRVCVSVCDAGGRLMSFKRMDGAIMGAVYGSQGKAVASASLGRPSGAIQADSPTAQHIAAAEGGHMVIGGQGAVPIIRNGLVEGACGVGGGTAQEDEDCARAGVDAL